MNLEEFKADLAENTPGMSLEDLFNDLKLATLSQSRAKVSSETWKFATAEVKAMQAEITTRCSK